MADFRPPRRFAGGPDPDDLRRWVAEGLTDTEIGELVGRLEGQAPASKQAVAHWRSKYGITRPSRRGKPLDHSDVRPWRVRQRHVGDGIEHRLYDYGRRRQGVELPPAAARRLDEFLAYLDEKRLVVDYDPDTEDGWLLRRRDRHDDPNNIIRHPDHPREYWRKGRKK